MSRIGLLTRMEEAEAATLDQSPPCAASSLGLVCRPRRHTAPAGDAATGAAAAPTHLGDGSTAGFGRWHGRGRGSLIYPWSHSCGGGGCGCQWRRRQRGGRAVGLSAPLSLGGQARARTGWRHRGAASY
jgi:hypothetical protein